MKIRHLIRRLQLCGFRNCINPIKRSVALQFAKWGALWSLKCSKPAIIKIPQIRNIKVMGILTNEATLLFLPPFFVRSAHKERICSFGRKFFSPTLTHIYKIGSQFI